MNGHIEKAVGNNDLEVGRNILDGSEEMVAGREERPILRSSQLSTNGLPLGFLPLVQPIIDEAAKLGIVLKMVLRHSPNDDGQTMTSELHNFTLVYVEGIDDFFIVHNFDI